VLESSLSFGSRSSTVVRLPLVDGTAPAPSSSAIVAGLPGLPVETVRNLTTGPVDPGCAGGLPVAPVAAVSG